MIYKYVDVSRVVNLDDWPAEDEAPIGKRPKRFVVDPATNKPFVFKEAKRPRLAAQIWAEIIGSFIAGDRLGLEVQFAGVGVRKGAFGNVLKFIYERDKEQFFEGYSYLKAAKQDFNVDRDHSIDMIVDVCAKELDGFATRSAIVRHWAQTLAFDMLISNVDRHTENWALITSAEGRRISPLFDNGSSLGCEVLEETLETD